MTSTYYRQRVAEHCEWYLKNNGNNRPDWWELIQAAATRDAGNTQPPFTITFYADLNANNKIGHVFVALSFPDGSVEYRGYYPKHPSPYDIGDLRDDRNHHYDVKKTFIIDQARSLAVRRLIQKWNQHPGIYAIPVRHCGVFARKAAEVSGLWENFVALGLIDATHNIPQSWFTMLLAQSGRINENGIAGSERDRRQILSTR